MVMGVIAKVQYHAFMLTITLQNIGTQIILHMPLNLFYNNHTFFAEIGLLV